MDETPVADDSARPFARLAARAIAICSPRWASATLKQIQATSSATPSLLPPRN